MPEHSGILGEDEVLSLANAVGGSAGCHVDDDGVLLAPFHTLRRGCGADTPEHSLLRHPSLGAKGANFELGCFVRLCVFAFIGCHALLHVGTWPSAC